MEETNTTPEAEATQTPVEDAVRAVVQDMLKDSTGLVNLVARIVEDTVDVIVSELENRVSDLEDVSLNEDGVRDIVDEAIDSSLSWGDLDSAISEKASEAADDAIRDANLFDVEDRISDLETRLDNASINI